METRAEVRPAAHRGHADVSTGVGILDHLLRLLAESAPFELALEVEPGAPDQEVTAAGRALGEVLAPLLREDSASGRGWAVLPADEALATVALEVTDRPLVVSNVDLTDQRVGGLGTDLVARFLDALAHAARLNLHVRLLEGRDPEHVLHAIFKALGAALGLAARPPQTRSEGE
jgi:imidazoleglycerol phosphate dehydratase HisB